MAKSEKTRQKILDRAQKRLGFCVKADNHNRNAAIEDLNFIAGEQWDAREKKRRSDKGRPALVLNFLPKFVDQVIGDMLHNTPAIKVRPDDSKADVQIAKIRQGIIRDIEYSSNSKGIYGYGARQQVSCGYGAWRILTRYLEDNPFLQEIYLEGIRNPFLLYMDPSAKDQNYADAQYGFLLEKVPKKDFEDKYPKAKYTSDSLKVGRGLADELWYDDDNVTVAEYFEKVKEPVTMYQMEDGKVVDSDELDVLKAQYEDKKKKYIEDLGTGKVPPQLPPDIMEWEPVVLAEKETDKIVIRHWVLTAFEILEGGDDGDIFPGKYIPLVLLKGKELNIEGKNHVYSLIRHAKDPQKLINYWNTSAAETIALAPKAPWVMTTKQLEGFEKDYAAANIENFPVLKYNPDPEAPGPPARVQTANPPVAIFEQIRRGEENLKSVLGMFNADVGGQISQQTGEAVRAAQKPGDVGTFEFMENWSRAIMYTGRVINEMIPEIYDTERDVRVRNIDDSETFVPVNTTVEAALRVIAADPNRYVGLDPTKLHSIYSKDGKDAKFNDITSGKYNIVISVGPSYSTQRAESASHMLQLIQAMPQQMSIAADLLVESMDFKDADEIAARIRKSLPPGIAKPRPGEAPPQPPPPNPQVMLAQAKLQIEQGKQQLQQMKIQQENLKLESDKVKAQIELIKLQQLQASPPEQQPSGPDPMAQQLEIMKMEHERLKMQSEDSINQTRQQLERTRLEAEIRKQELALQQARELHRAKLEELQVASIREELKAKHEIRKIEKSVKDPLNIRKKRETK